MTRSIRFFCFAVLILGLGLGGCAPKGPDVTRFGLADAVLSRDLEILPQSLMAFADRNGPDAALMESARQGREDERFNERFFAAWATGYERHPETEIFEGMHNMSANGFAENLRPWGRERWESLAANSFKEAYGTFPVRPAITVAVTHLRRMPTDAPWFRNPGTAGEGFPFDYLQNSALWPGTPVAVSHVSRDRQWVYAQTALVSGWTQAENVAAVDAKFMREWRGRPLAVIVRDNTDISLTGGKPDAVTGGPATVRTHLGTILPLAGTPRGKRPSKDLGIPVLVPVRGADGKALAMTGLAPTYAIWRKPAPLTPANIARAGDAMMGQPYGWGGLFALRDCSATTHDLFAPFGIWLPRNSRPQGETGRRIELADLRPDEKEARIMRDGVPFFSLVSMKGHVGLYLGTYTVDGKETPVMFHNLWGLRVKKGRGKGAPDGRAVIGKAVVTTLRPGTEHPSISSPAGLLDRITGLAVLPEPLPDEDL